MSDELKYMAVSASINTMLNSSMFDINPVSNALEILGVSKTGQAYVILRSLHCVEFEDIPPVLYAELPALITEAMAAPGLVSHLKLKETSQGIQKSWGVIIKPWHIAVVFFGLVLIGSIP